jgi:hypothetical protein
LSAPWTFRHKVDEDVGVHVDCITSICIPFDDDTDLCINETIWVWPEGHRQSTMGSTTVVKHVKSDRSDSRYVCACTASP